ncbi:hypothetical protein F5880DRAFT_1622475 [Lentinula raphanica]|nr:hypothetical protein F5880DRAFT_1622475 [Lentinula raphanica]
MDSNTTSSLTLSIQRDGIDSPGSSVFDLPIHNSTQALQTSNADTLASLRPPVPHHHEPTSLNSDSFVLISGGTGGNAICTAFPDACYVLPVSDDGGSSSEIIRVLGGPSVGDIRSRLVRLIPPAPASSPLNAIRTLFAYRLPHYYSERQAREEWRDIIEGRSPLWNGIPTDRKETIRACNGLLNMFPGFLVYFESEILRRAHKNFTFVNGRLIDTSIGNYFIAAAQGFFRSLPSAIFLFSSITNSQANILPVIVTNHTVTIAAEMENGERIVGQCDISHPVATAQAPTINVVDECSRISRLLYINAYGIEIHPSPNPDYLLSLRTSKVLVYSCGSLWTSIMPCLALQGVASAIARSGSLQAKILLLNSKNDRETAGYTAVDYIQAIARTLNTQYQHQPYGLGNAQTMYPISAFITDLIHLRGGAVVVDVDRITALGVRCTEVDPEEDDESNGDPKLSANIVRRAVNGIVVRFSDF